jgi:hypothetical protein
MHLGGVKTSEISQYFGIGQRMVQRDLQDAQRLMREQVQGLDSGSTLGREIRFLETTRRLAIRQSQLATQEAVRLGYLRTALDAASRLVALLQSTGLIRQVPQRIVLEDSNPFTDVDFRKKYMALLLEARKRGVPIAGL